MDDRAATVARYTDASAEGDPGRRLEILDEIWADEGVYVEPERPDGLRGRQALSEFITESQDEIPGLTIVAQTEVSVLGDRA